MGDGYMSKADPQDVTFMVVKMVNVAPLDPPPLIVVLLVTKPLSTNIVVVSLPAAAFAGSAMWVLHGSVVHAAEVG